MSFCPTCGRQRSADSRFCAGCGHDFREQAPDDGTAPAAEAPWEATRWDAPVDATRLEPLAGEAPPAEPTRLADAPATANPAEPDPFATWFAPDVPAPPAGQPAPPRGWPDDSRTGGSWAGDDRPGDNWQTADTVYATPARSPSYRPPGAGPGSGYPPAGQGYPPPRAGDPQPGPGYPPRGPDYGEPARRTSRGARAALIIVIVLVVLGAGGAAYAFISRSSTPSAAGPGPTASRSAASSASASPARSARASARASAPASASASASPSPSLVSVDPGVGSRSATPQVVTVLSRFFQGINTHRYTEYISALDAQERAKQTQSSFTKGYSTTSDSGMTLTSLTAAGSGGLAATVTFTSHQAASSSVDHSTCNTWTLTFYLVPKASGRPGYLDGAAPSGYQPRYADC